MKKIVFALLIIHSSLLIVYAQWQPDLRLTNNDSASYTSANNGWCIASSGNAVHALWMDIRTGVYKIFYKRSTDGGVSWGADTQVATNTIYDWLRYPSISVSGSSVHIVWSRNHNASEELHYRHSLDGGVTWGPDMFLLGISTIHPSIAASGSTVHIVTQSGGGGQLYYIRSTDEGSSWAPQVLLTVNQSGSFYPSVSVSGSFVHVAWYDNRDGNNEIYYNHSTDGGISWGTETRLTNNPASSSYPSIAVYASTVHVAWGDNRDGNYEIYYKHSTDGGTSWGTDARLTNSPDSSLHPSLLASGTAVHVVWQDYRDGNNEIYYKRSTDGGINWGTDTRLTINPAVSQNPSVSASGSSVHVVWDDNRDGNYEIYYKRDPTGNLIGIKSINSEIPKEYSLSQNYPNPFNPVTSIRLQVPGSSLVKILVYDILGHEVTTLVNEQLNAGTYEVDWDASNYPSGVYYYKLISGDYTDTKKMILIK